MMVREIKIEKRLKDGLEAYGFKCIKLVTPGSAGIPDRLILAPKWSPSPPVFVELKAPNKKERSLQTEVANDMRWRGCCVKNACDTFKKVDDLVDSMLLEAVWRIKWPDRIKLPEHILTKYRSLTYHIKEEDERGAVKNSNL